MANPRLGGELAGRVTRYPNPYVPVELLPYPDSNAHVIWRRTVPDAGDLLSYYSNMGVPMPAMPVAPAPAPKRRGSGTGSKGSAGSTAGSTGQQGKTQQGAKTGEKQGAKTEGAKEGQPDGKQGAPAAEAGKETPAAEKPAVSLPKAIDDAEYGTYGAPDWLRNAYNAVANWFSKGTPLEFKETPEDVARYGSTSLTPIWNRDEAKAKPEPSTLAEASDAGEPPAEKPTEPKTLVEASNGGEQPAAPAPAAPEPVTPAPAPAAHEPVPSASALAEASKGNIAAEPSLKDAKPGDVVIRGGVPVQVVKEFPSKKPTAEAPASAAPAAPAPAQPQGPSLKDAKPGDVVVRGGIPVQVVREFPTKQSAPAPAPSAPAAPAAPAPAQPQGPSLKGAKPGDVVIRGGVPVQVVKEFPTKQGAPSPAPAAPAPAQPQGPSLKGAKPGDVVIRGGVPVQVVKEFPTKQSAPAPTSQDAQLEKALREKTQRWAKGDLTNEEFARAEKAVQEHVRRVSQSTVGALGIERATAEYLQRNQFALTDPSTIKPSQFLRYHLARAERAMSSSVQPYIDGYLRALRFRADKAASAPKHSAATTPSRIKKPAEAKPAPAQEQPKPAPKQEQPKPAPKRNPPKMKPPTYSEFLRREREKYSWG